MGKSASASPVEEKHQWEKHKTKKGRPSLLDIERRNLRIQRLQELESERKQQGGRQKSDNPSNPNLSPSPARRPSQRYPGWDLGAVKEGSRGDSGVDDADEDDEVEDGQAEAGRRRQMKLSLVLGLPPNGLGDEMGPCSSESEGDGGRESKKRRIEAVSGSAECETDKRRSASRLTQGEPSGSGGLTPLPDKQLLVFILDRLQKKDIYGVFSEPVDPDELPDYHDVIEHPMDFSTIRKKLSCGSYVSLEEFEEDVFLVSSNAMRYNGSDTIYFRQARAIEALAKKDFENLRHDGDGSELECKRADMAKMPGRDAGTKPASRPLADIDVHHASINPLPPHNDHRSTVLTSELSDLASQKPQYGSTHVNLDDYKLHKNDESSGSSLKERLSKKNIMSKEKHQNIYKHPTTNFAFQPQILTTFDEEKKELVTVGVHVENAYARSLARFSAKFGHIGWEIVVKLIGKSLPPGTKFGRGWVGEKDAPQQIQTPLFPKISIVKSSAVLFPGTSEAKRSAGKPEVSSVSSNMITANKVQTSHMLCSPPAAETVTEKHSKKVEHDVFLKSSDENVLDTGTAVQSNYIVSHPNKQTRLAKNDSHSHLGNNYSHDETIFISLRQTSNMAKEPKNSGMHNSNNSMHPGDFGRAKETCNSLTFSSFATTVSQLNEEKTNLEGPPTASDSTSNLLSQAMIHAESERSRTNYSGTLNSMSSFIRQSSSRDLDTGNTNLGKQCDTNSVNGFIYPAVNVSFEIENPKTNGHHEVSHGDNIFSSNTVRSKVDRAGTRNALLQPTATLLYESQLAQRGTFGSLDSRRLLNFTAATGPAKEEISAAKDGIPTNAGKIMNEWVKDSRNRRLQCLSLSQTANSIPPDLNIRFQAPSSPAAAVTVDTQHPDLALQL